jgi:BirA family biotin operon repressor/biotin-[acetyl-CoA-carboxylase] ligase
LQRAWSSPKGAGLYFSILLQPTIAADQWPLITFMAALAVGDALSEACDVNVDIKWPNDLLSGERKICGILAESVETPTGRSVIVGIGINLSGDAYPSEIANAAISVAEASGRAAERETLLTALLQGLSRWYSLLHELDGPSKIVAAWTSRSSYASGKRVQVANGDEVWQGITRGVEPDGALRLETTDGMRIVRAGDVSVRERA